MVETPHAAGLTSAQPRLLECEEGVLVGEVLARMTGLPIERLRLGDKEHPSAEALGTSDSDSAPFFTPSFSRELARSVLDPQVVLGIQASNWPVVGSLQRWAERAKGKDSPNSNDRSKLQTLSMYLQRLCAKCDSNGAFGPVSWGRLDTRESRPVAVDPAGERFGIGRSDVHVSYWVASSLFRRLVLPLLPPTRRVPRKHPTTLIEGGVATRMELLDGPNTPPTRLELDGPTRRVLGLCDGARTVEDVAAESLLPTDEVLHVLRSLEDSGWVEMGPEVPVGLGEPLDWISAFARQNLEPQEGSRVLDVVHGLQQRRETYRGSVDDWTGRGEAIEDATQFVAGSLDTNGTRGAGELYADRYVFSEDATRDWRDFRLGEPTIRVLRDDLMPLLRILMTVPATRWVDRHEAMSDWFAGKFGGGSVPLSKFCSAVHSDFEVVGRLMHDSGRRADGRARRLRELFVGPSPTGAQEVRVDRGEVEAFGREQPLPPCTVQPDVMIVPSTPNPRLVLGDVHATHDLLTQSPLALLHQNPDGLARTVEEGYEAVFSDSPCVPVLEHDDKTLISAPLPGRDVEVSGKSRKGVDQVIPVGALCVRTDGDRLRLVGPEGEPVILTRVPTWSPHDRDSVLSLFAPPLVGHMEEDVWPADEGARRLPRTLFGDVVVVRRTWALHSSDLGDRSDARVFSRSLARWSAENGAPGHFFVRLPFERKPVLVDTTNPFLTEWLRKKLRGAEIRFTISEMYPDQQHLWLRDRSGHYCIEFRMSAFLKGD